MQQRPLGKTGLNVSIVSFGAGPVSGLMTGRDLQQQQATIARAIEWGINWFDTAPGYGNGESERNLGRAFADLGVGHDVHVATKVRLAEADWADMPDAIRRSAWESIERLGRAPLTLLQLHNAITANRGDEPSSITPDDVLKKRGVLEAFEELKQSQAVRHIGLTGIGQPDALREVIRCGSFQTVQTPYSLLNRSAGEEVSPGFAESNYGRIIADCASRQMGVLAIRVFAAGALLGNRPSAHTHRTPFFPLALYTRDTQRAARLRARLAPQANLRSIALQYVMANSNISTALIGFGSPHQVDQAVSDALPEPMPDNLRLAIREWQADEQL
jgi:aryl-alcohol dehydrogenase-like predicted oxidoreductase